MPSYILTVAQPFTDLHLLVDQCRRALEPLSLMFDGTDGVEAATSGTSSGTSGTSSVTLAYDRDLTDAELGQVRAVLAAYDEASERVLRDRADLDWTRYALTDVRCAKRDSFQSVLSWHDPLDHSKLIRAIVTSYSTPTPTNSTGQSSYEMRIVDLCVPVVIASGTFDNETDAMAVEMPVTDSGTPFVGQYPNITQELQVRLGADCQHVTFTSVALGWRR
jgi:hypothetical protein